jgi:hypothetical protein
MGRTKMLIEDVDFPILELEERVALPAEKEPPKDRLDPSVPTVRRRKEELWRLG